MPDSFVTRARTALSGHALDARDVVLRRREAYVPPRHLQPPGVADFVESGRVDINHLITLGGLGPDERVIEVGCGIGRLARPLADYLGPGATYDGFDVDARAIDWCLNAYRHRPDFEFAHVDVRSERQQPGGSIDPAQFRFPYPDASRELVLMIDVLPQLLPEAIENYAREARRVLLPAGRLFATTYLLDDRARAAIAGGSAALAFGDALGSGGRYALVDPGTPGELIAHDEEWLLDAVSAAGFKTAGIRHGTWSRGDEGRTFHDILVARL